MTPRSDSSVLTITADNPSRQVAKRLIQDLCSELTKRYGTPPSPFSPATAVTPRSAFLVARLGGQPVGCGALRQIDDTTAEVKRMYVAPFARRRGIARRILTELERLATEFNYQSIRLETGIKQSEAIAFYDSSGYQRIATYSDFVDNRKSICFEKRLT
jgi:putative acetyltransferase